MPAEYATRSRITIDRGRAEAALDFDRAAGKGKVRAAAVRRLAAVYRVEARHPYRTLHYNPAGSDAPLPTPDELHLDVSGDPERVARYLSAVPRYLARVEALATKAARTYGRWARSVAGEEALEYTDAGGRRAYARRFRVEAFAAVADAFGISSLPRYVDPAAPMWDQAARIAWDVVKAEGPVSLYAMHDEAEAEELLAAADRTPDPAAEAFERELAELRAAERRRSARLFAALDGEELPADEAPVEEAAAEDVVEDQEGEELPAVELTPVQRRWLHTAAAHPEGYLPAAVNLRTARGLGAAGLIAWTRPQGRTVPVAEAVWKLDAGEVRITAAGRRRAAAEERERVVIVACGGRKAVYADGIRKGEPVIGARAGELYVGSYHRAMRRAADVLTQGGRSGRVLILSAKYGLVKLDRHLLNYDLRAGDPGTVDGETLRRQAHELGISGAAVTVLGGRAYVELAGEVWDDVAAPLAGARGIGEQLARLAAIYDPTRADDFVEAVGTATRDVVESQVQEDAGSLGFTASVRPVELVPSACQKVPRPVAGCHLVRQGDVCRATQGRHGTAPTTNRTWFGAAIFRGKSRRLTGTAKRRASIFWDAVSVHHANSARRTSGVPGRNASGSLRTERNIIHAVICTCRLDRPPGLSRRLGEEGGRQTPLRLHGRASRGRQAREVEGHGGEDPRRRQPEGRRGEDHHHRQPRGVHVLGPR
ncbi:DUF6884 domain-containing protein [Streptomyces sp. NPDC127106]|uniref:DUF6884 domain-containing protein n=1 Tax=Streptomyces sp. NPDC127106 TaxID=3345360 RepID=UPI003640D238